MRRAIALTFLVFLFTAEAPGQEPPAEAPQPPAVPDATRVYSFDSVVVVFPVGPGEDIEKNRRSARLRAQFLQETRGIQAREVADDQVGPAEKAENLIVLGWGNRILASNDAPPPFTRTERGFVFLGIEHPDPSADLVFFSRSPFRNDKYLFFWSRIDPELDRFQILPWVGSSWAVYRDFLVQRQGMFAAGGGWPPVRNPDAEIDRRQEILEIDADRGVRRSTHYDVYHDKTEAMTRELDAIVEAREAAFAKAVSAVGSPPEGFRIRLLLYNDPKDKKSRTGIEDAGHSVPGKAELHLTLRFAKSPSPHEEIHILARRILGPCVLTSLYEGLAVAEDGVFAGTDLDLLAAAMVESGSLPSLDQLLREPRMRALPEKIGFASAALMVRWLRATSGTDGLTKIYTMTDGGVDALARVLGKPADALESSFRSWTAERAAARRSEVDFLKHQAEAQQRYLAGDYVAVAASLEQASRAKPDDAQTLFNLASAQMRIDEYEKAEKNLRKISSLSLAKKDGHLLVFSHYQLGRLFDLQGRRDDAVAQYRQVLELPDDHDAHRLAREALEKPFTKEQLQ